MNFVTGMKPKLPINKINRFKQNRIGFFMHNCLLPWYSVSRKNEAAKVVNYTDKVINCIATGIIYDHNMFIVQASDCIIN